MKLNLTKLNMWVTFSLMLFVYGYFAYGANAAYSIGLVLTSLLFVLEAVLNGRSLVQSFRSVITKEEVLSILLVMLLLSECFSTLINYPRGMHWLLLYQGPVLLIGVIMLFMPAENKWLLIRAFFPIALIALAYGIYNYSWETFTHYHVHHRFDRNANVATVLLLPFLLNYLFLDSARNRVRVAIAGIVTIYLLLTLLWSGERGAWGAVFIEMLIIGGCLARGRLFSPKKLFSVIVIGGLMVLVAGGVLYKTNPNFKHKVDIGFKLDGRGVIVKTRFPLFIHSDKTVLGFGYSDTAYNDFFRQKKAPHVYGVEQNGRYHYFQDEPFYLQIFYHFGAVGLVIFLCFTFFFLYRINQRRKSASTQLGKLFYAALLASFVGYFIIGGLFEGRATYYMLFMYFLFMTAVGGLDHQPIDSQLEGSVSTST